MVRKLVVVFLLVLVSQSTFAAHAAMHFPGTASVDHSVFKGSGRVEGFGNFITSSKVSLQLNGALQPICQSDGYEPEDPEAVVGINFSEDAPALTHNGQTSFSFSDVNLIPLVGNCDDAPLTPIGVKGTLNVKFIANEFKNPSTLFAQAVLPFTCNIDESVSFTTKCVQGQEVTTTNP